MPHIEYIGFVVRQQEKNPEDIVAACVAKFEEFGNKKIWKTYPIDKTKFIPMLFVTSVLVREKFAHLPIPESGISEDGVLLRKPNPQIDFILSYLSDVWRKGGRYGAIYEDLRHATKFFFCARGKEETVRFHAPAGGMRPVQLFFWTFPDFLKKASLKDLPKMPTELNNIEDTPQSSQDILPGISKLAEKVRLYLAEPKPWQELYKKALERPENLPKHRIPLYGSKVESRIEDQQALLYKGSQLQLSEMLTQDRKILLTGPSGSGKTTIQKILMADLIGSRPPIQNCLPIFVSMKYVGLNGKSVTDLIVDSVVKEILTAKSLKSTIQQQIDIRRAHHGDMFNSDFLTDTKSARKQMAESLFKAEVRDYFTSNEQNGDNEIALFLDGRNEISETEEYYVEKEIERISQIVDKMVVSTRSYGAGRLLPNFKKYELEELTDAEDVPGVVEG